MDLNYFVCTLGQAAHHPNGRPFKDVNHLIDTQASVSPGLPAVGFYTPASDRASAWKHHVFDFAAVKHISIVVAELIIEHLDISPGQTVGLLAASSPEFLFTWLALIRLGHPVLLIAPQCSASAIAHLSKTCDAPILFHDAAHEDLAEQSVEAGKTVGFSEIKCHRLPCEGDSDVVNLLTKKPKSDIEAPSCSDSHIAYLHHTSGTSTGVPKPIPQSHRAAVGVLPSLTGSKHATFTTTPLYHGGVADLFRAWSSSAMIWLFPGQHVPITATNVVNCLTVSKSCAESDGKPSVRYFSSVPYILQMMAQDEQGLSYLRSMNIVGVGGAALPADVGDKLVKDGVNLISRFGSAECGFLMSSHRDYASDKDWQFLRHDTDVHELRFEVQEDGLSELVILDGWPHMAKRNRDDGSFATADLFARHPDVPNAWKYHSRADSQLTLITGKKFDPAPLEDSIAASSTSIQDVLIFGNDKPYPGALIFRSKSAKDLAEEDLIHELAPSIESLNSESQSHARISRNMLVVMPYLETPLAKSSKGTVLRGQALERYGQEIKASYEKVTLNGKSDVPDQELPEAILNIVTSVVGNGQDSQEKLGYNTDLFSHGVDSIACVQIRHVLTQLLPENTAPLPLTVVEDSGTISQLSKLLIRLRHGQTAEEQEDQRTLLQCFVDQYGCLDSAKHAGLSSGTENDSEEVNVLLTGPTGSLGSHILSQLALNLKVNKIYLLVRGATPHAARERVIKALSQRSLGLPLDFDKRVVILPCKISEAHLGLSKEDYHTLTCKVNLIFHLAWSVNFLLPLRSFATIHLAGLKNLLDLAKSSTLPQPPKVLFCSSVASTQSLLQNAAVNPIPESIVLDTSASGPTGYALSKQAAELICHSYAEKTNLKNNITILRVGQLSGDTTNGVWSKTEAYPLILGSAKVTNILPDLGSSEKLNWLPVNIAAKGFIEAALTQATSHPEDPSIQVLHLLNPSQKTTWLDLLSILQNPPTNPKTDVISSPTTFKITSPTVWLKALDALNQDPKTKHHPALKLLSFWRTAYGDSSPLSSSSSSSSSPNDNRPNREEKEGGEENYPYVMDKSLRIMPSVRDYVGPLEPEYILRLWRWIQENIE